MKTAILDTEVIYEEQPLREWAADAVASYRQRRQVEQKSFREGYNHCIWLPEDVRWLWQQQVERPAVGEIQQRLYGGRL